MMLQQPAAEEFVLATGETHSVRELLEVAFSAAGLDWQKYVEIDPKLIRPAEVDHLRGDSAKAQQKLGWNRSVGFKQLIEMMVKADLKVIERSMPSAVTATA